MNFFKNLFSGDKDSQSVKFLRKDETQGAVYEIYQANDAETAKTFLFTKNVTEDKYYILVETPEGAWGIDKFGLYLEQLMEFQKNIENADFDGEICSYDFVDSPGFEIAANGINDYFIAKLKCGQCQNEWLDAVQYNNLTAACCPSCKATNRIDTRNISRVTTAQYPIFNQFLEFVDDEDRDNAITNMSSNSMPHELLAVYGTTQTFQGAVDSAKTLPRNYHPILVRGNEGGALYIRGAFIDGDEFDTIANEFEKNSCDFIVERN